MSTVNEACADACARAGVIFRDVPADNRFHAADIFNDPSGRGDARIKLFADGNGGLIHNWKTDETIAFFTGDPRRLNADDRIERRRLADLASQRAALERHQAQLATATRAERLLQQTKACSNSSGYLTRKGLAPCAEVRSLGQSLIVPVSDIAGKLWSLQFIAPDGSKKFLRDGRKLGCLVWIGGQKAGVVHVHATETSGQCGRSGQLTPKIVICEGIATAISVHRLSGLPVACAFDAGNLDPVAQAIRELHSRSQLIIGADNDPVGIDKARLAAFRHGAKVCFPPEPGEDWNDAHKRLGESAARALWLEVSGES